jgi:hypothetical protein
LSLKPTVDTGKNESTPGALTLALFVLGILLVDHVNASFPTDDLVVGTSLLDARLNFHRAVLLSCGQKNRSWI